MICSSVEISALKETVIAVDANYWLVQLLQQEPLVTAVGGPMVMKKYIDDELNHWAANGISPHFVFDGCAVKGEDKVLINAGREANAGTDEAWASYAEGSAHEAVLAFGKYQSTCFCCHISRVIANITLKRHIVYNRSTLCFSLC